MIQLLNSGTHGEQTLVTVSPADVQEESDHVAQLICNDLCQLVQVNLQGTWWDDGSITIDVDEIRFIKAQNDAAVASLQNLGRQVVTSGMSEKQAVKAINDWICARYSYIDNGNPSHIAASSLNTGVAACQPYTTTFEQMARGAGLRAECIYGIANGGNGTETH